MSVLDELERMDKAATPGVWRFSACVDGACDWPDLHIGRKYYRLRRGTRTIRSSPRPAMRCRPCCGWRE